MDTNYGMEIVRATEIAALTAARLQGLGDHIDILNQTRRAIDKTLNRLPVSGTLINDRFLGRADSFQLSPILGKGQEKTDLMTIALEAYRSAADGKNNSTSFAVIAKAGAIQSVPNLNMYKMVVGPQTGNVIDINQPPIINVKRVARALRKYTENVTVCILNQTRHKQLIHEVRSCGARIKLIDEGEVSGCLAAITGEKADIYIGYGYAPEAVMVAAAISCLGGYMEGKIFYENDRDKKEASRHGIDDFNKIYRSHDLIRSKEVAIAATGITDGEFLEGVRFTANGAITSSFVARGETHTYRRLETRHFFDFKPVF
jgi:fructose-1,6-bisphosphatase II